jgi:multisubunit Na+/H+ antiporter MnhG subunit
MKGRNMNQSNTNDNAGEQQKREKPHLVSRIFILLGAASCLVAAIFSFQQNGAMSMRFGVIAFVLILIGFIASKVLPKASVNPEKK